MHQADYQKNEAINEDQKPVAYDANWEDPALFCDDCVKRIESAYAEDDPDEAADAE